MTTEQQVSEQWRRLEWPERSRILGAPHGVQGWIAQLRRDQVIAYDPGSRFSERLRSARMGSIEQMLACGKRLPDTRFSRNVHSVREWERLDNLRMELPPRRRIVAAPRADEERQAAWETQNGEGCEVFCGGDVAWWGNSHEEYRERLRERHAERAAVIQSAQEACNDAATRGRRRGVAELGLMADFRGRFEEPSTLSSAV